MPTEIDPRRLADLLIDPRESLDFEVKNWLNLLDNNDDKATFAKAVLALANHGGGFIALGLEETDEGIVEAGNRPSNLNGYDQDTINGIVERYCDPSFHCAVYIIPNPDDTLFPIVVVPGGHRTPICAKRGSPNEKTLIDNAIYIRRLGPRSETPQSAEDWNDLLQRCFLNRRDEMFDQMRGLILGAVPQISQPDELTRLNEWIKSCYKRWRTLIEPLPDNVGPKMPHGHYCFAYEIAGERRQIAPHEMLQVLSASVVRCTGWPPFWCPTRSEIKPYLFDDMIECWIGGDTRTPAEDRDAADSDFWRIHPDGLAFLIRGFQEDGIDMNKAGAGHVQPATVFDVVLPIWRAGETLLHARSLANNLFEGPTTIKFVAIYEGLANRSLESVMNFRHYGSYGRAHQHSIKLDTNVDTQVIESSLPEIVHHLLSPLYALFDFYELPMEVVVDELARMRGRKS